MTTWRRFLLAAIPIAAMLALVEAVRDSDHSRTVSVADGVPASADSNRTAAPVSTQATSSRASVHAAAHPLQPPPGQSLIGGYQTLSLRAARGSAEAASELFSYVEMCLKARRTIDSAAAMVDSWNHDEIISLPNWNVTSAQAQERSLSEWQTRVRAVAEQDADCESSDGLLTDPVVFDIRWQAAKRGDADAALCYVRGKFEQYESAADEAFMVDYRRNALTLIDARLKAGDWRMVRLMPKVYGPVGPWAHGDGRARGARLLYSHLARRDVMEQYRYLKLLSLGETDLEKLKGLNDTLNWKATELSSERISQADRWASEMYERHFGTSTNLSEPACSE
jgi:hypothetical protein